jgi:tetratricopeptide (TPR) repeat protein
LNATWKHPEEEHSFKAFQAMKKALKLSGELEQIQLFMLQCFDYQAKLGASEKRLAYGKKKIFLEKAISVRPDNPNLLMELGALCVQFDEDREYGYRYLMRAITLDPDLFESNYHLGEYYFGKGDFRQAYHYYLKMVEQPVFPSLWIQILDRMQKMV